jgi:hypothetical protein
MYNLLKILNKGRCLKGLNSIDEVYDHQVNVIDEIVFYHENKDTLNKSELDETHSILNESSLVKNIDSTVMVNEQVENQGVLEELLNKEQPVEREVKSTLFNKRK